MYTPGPNCIEYGSDTEPTQIFHVLSFDLQNETVDTINSLWSTITIKDSYNFPFIPFKVVHKHEKL